jgi:hypothetical protein
MYKQAQSDPSLVAYVQKHGFPRSPGSMDFEVLCPGVLQNLVWDTTCPMFLLVIKILYF